MSIENDTVTGGEYPSWDNHTAKLIRDAKASAELFTPPLYKWMEYADNDRNPLGVTDGKVLTLNPEGLKNLKEGTQSNGYYV